MTTHADKCPICGEGSLCERVMPETVEYKGRSEMLGMTYSECTACGSEQASTAQARANKRTVIAFKKRVDGLLEGKEIARLRAALCITQAKAAEIFGGGPVAFSKYENDDITQSESMDTLIRLAAALPSARTWLLERPDKTVNWSLFPTKALVSAKPIPAAKPPKASILNVRARAYPRHTIGIDATDHLFTAVKKIGVELSMLIEAGNFPRTNLFNEEQNRLKQTTPRMYGEEENSEHYFSLEYSETAYDQHSI